MVSSPLQALNSNVTFEMYFLAILATSLRYDARICIVVGTIGVAQYAALWAFADDAATTSTIRRYFADTGPYSPVDLFTRLILLGISTLLAVTIVRRAQRLLYLAARDRLTGLYNRGHFDRSPRRRDGSLGARSASRSRSRSSTSTTSSRSTTCTATHSAIAP